MSKELIEILIQSAAAIAAMMVAVWLVSLWRKDASIVDLIWGLGFVLIAWLTYWSRYADDRPPSLILPCLTTVWGLRLSAYLTWRNHGKSEDFRYRAMREKWGDKFPLVSLLIVFGLQGIVMWIVSLPLQVGIAGGNHVIWLSTTGVALWAIGLLFESVGDWQLARFKAVPENAGRVLDTGLWRYTRHPNYFGECLLWWGLFLIAVSQSSAWWIVISPVIMSFLLLRVSGVTLLEKTLQNTKPEYAEYVARTNAFWPGLPKQTRRPRE